MTVLWHTWVQAFPAFLGGVRVTLELTGVSLLIALVLGFLLALARLSGVGVLRGAATGVVEVIRSIPTLILLFTAYYSLPQIGITVSGFVAAVGTLGIFYATLYGEIFRGAILAVDRGQREAAQALGLSPVTSLRTVILPQAFLRILPPATNQLSNLIKDTSLVFTIGLADLMFQAYNAGASNFRYFDMFILAGVLYFACYLILSKLLARWEMNVQRQRA